MDHETEKVAAELREVIELIDRVDADIAAAEDKLGLVRSNRSDPLTWRLKRLGLPADTVSEVDDYIRLVSYPQALANIGHALDAADRHLAAIVKNRP